MTRTVPEPMYGRKHIYLASFNTSHGLLLLIGLLLAALLSACAGTGTAPTEISGHMKISGSTALKPLAEEGARQFRKLHPQANIEVVGNGSINGLKDVMAGKSNIGDSDIYADFASYPDPNMTDHIVCVIPFTMIVNPDVPVNSLTKEQIIQIFSTGQITNWREVGGPDLTITPVVRPETSGTRDTFRKYILGGRDENTGSRKLLKTDSSDTVVATVAETPGAIGYLAASVLKPTVHPIAIDNVTPTRDNIVSGHYTFWSYEHMYTLGDDNTMVSSYLDFMLTQLMQQKAQQLGYIPIAVMKLPTAHWSGGEQRDSAASLAVLKEREDTRHESYYK